MCARCKGVGVIACTCPVEAEVVIDSYGTTVCKLCENEGVIDCPDCDGTGLPVVGPL